MIVVDTTVLVYAVGADHPLREPCRYLVESIAGGDVVATTTVEVIQEFAHLRARRRTRSDAADLARSFAELLSPLLFVEDSDLHEGLRLFETHPRLGSFDSVLAAAAHSVGARALVSADSAFAGAAGTVHVFPTTDAIKELVSTSP